VSFLLCIKMALATFVHLILMKLHQQQIH